MQVFTDVRVTTIEASCQQYGLLQCADGSCYSPSLRCNNVLDCRDGSDEAKCETFVLLHGDLSEELFQVKQR